MITKKQLILDKYGLFLSKHSERVRVKAEGAIVEEVPLIHLDSIMVTSRGITISSDIVEVCSERGIDIIFISGNGKVYGRLGSPTLIGTVKTRRDALPPNEEGTESLQVRFGQGLGLSLVAKRELKGVIALTQLSRSC